MSGQPSDGAIAMLKQAVEEIPLAVTTAIFRYGVDKGLESNNRDWFLKSELSPNFKALSFSWSRGQGVIKLFIYYTNTTNPLYQEIIISRSVCQHFFFAGPDFLVEAIQAMDAIIHKLMGGIKQVNSIRFCQCPTHQNDTGIRTLDECKPIGDKWLCDDCVDKYSLLAEIPIRPNEKPYEKSERAKMTTSLRFSIMERDNFCCRACGRDPRIHKVKLHVDHIVPVIKGGKTEPSNLHTLCQDCNLGKSDKTVNQMEKWNE